MSTGFFEETDGQKSMTRLCIFLLIVAGIVQVSAIIAAGAMVFIKSAGAGVSLLAICTAAGTLFTSVVVPCLIWKNVQKGNEQPETTTTTEPPKP